MNLDLELEKVASGPSLAKETETSAEVSHSEKEGTSASGSITCRC